MSNLWTPDQSGLWTPPTRQVYIPDDERLAVPSEAPISCGSRQPAGGPAFKDGKWSLWAMQRRGIIRARRVFATGEAVSLFVGVPGTGKSSAAQFMAWELIALGAIRLVFWVVPTEFLALQAIESVRQFLGPQFKLFVGKNTGPDELNPENPWHLGYVITYAMLNQPGAVEMWIDRLRQHTAQAAKVGRTGGVLCVYDECHHLADTLEQALATDDTDPGVSKKTRKTNKNENERSFRPWSHIPTRLHEELVVDPRGISMFRGHSLLMTATLERQDGAPVPLVPYCENHDPSTREECRGTVRSSDPSSIAMTAVPVIDSIAPVMKVPHIHVEATYKDGHDDRALKSLSHIEIPAKVSFRLRTDKKSAPDRTHDTDDQSLTLVELRQSLAVCAALHRPDQVDEVVKRYLIDSLGYCVAHWIWWRNVTGVPWGLFAATTGQVGAAWIAMLLVTRWSIDAGLAISGTGDEGRRAVKIWEENTGREFVDGKKVLAGFRDGHHEALVAASMANEGYDVPRISHTLLYTITRALTTLVQIIGRGGRRYPRWSGDQYNFFFHPGDRLVLEALNKIANSCGGASFSELNYAKRPPMPTDESDERGRRESNVVPVQAKLIKPTRRALVAVKAELSGDEKMLKDLRSWTRGSRSLSKALDRRCAGWRSLEGSRLRSVWDLARKLRGQ